jgi:hypothetical protein
LDRNINYAWKEELLAILRLYEQSGKTLCQIIRKVKICLGEYDFSEERLRGTVGIKPPHIVVKFQAMNDQVPDVFGS